MLVKFSTLRLAISINFFALSPNSPHLPLDKIYRAFLIGVKGVLNSCETMEINSDFTLSNFSNSSFFSMISL